jgi:hypothetical protein
MEEFYKGDTVCVYSETGKSVKGLICYQDLWIEYDNYRIVVGKHFIDIFIGQGSVICTTRMVLMEKTVDFVKKSTLK